ncbi:SET domain-containing protein-lysine N-methyltransferase [Alicyclobacillus pomorum]
MNTKPPFESDERFYPVTIGIHPNEPTKDKFSMKYQPTFGEGVVATTFFGKGELICRFDGALLTHQTLYTLQKRPGVYIEDPFFMGKILHSCHPNTTVDMDSQTFWATKDIQPSDFITMDYESTEDQLFRSFHCQCGSYQCRGHIVGKLVNSKLHAK